MHKISFICLVMTVGMMPSFSFADAHSVKMLPGEAKRVKYVLRQGGK